MMYFVLSTLMMICSVNVRDLAAQNVAFVTFASNPVFTINESDENVIKLTFMIDDKYHIQAAATKDEYLIPTRLTFVDTQEIAIDTIGFPPSKQFWMNGVEQPLDVFSHQLDVEIKLRVAKLNDKRQYPVKGRLYYQACDSFKCYYPRSLEFQIMLTTK